MAKPDADSGVRFTNIVVVSLNRRESKWKMMDHGENNVVRPHLVSKCPIVPTVLRESLMRCLKKIAYPG